MHREGLSPERLTDGYISFVVLLLPLFTGLHGYQHITSAKFGLFAALTGVWLSGLGLLRLRGERDDRPWPGALRWLGWFLLWGTLSVIFSPWPLSVTFLGGSWRTGWLSAALYVSAGVFTARYGVFRMKYVRLLGVSVTLCCAVAVLQIRGGNPLGLFPHGWRFADAGTLYSGMYLGTVGNTLVLASVLSLAIPLFLCGAIRSRGWDLLLLIPAALGLYVIIKSDASSGEAALLGALWLGIPFLFRGRMRKRAFLGMIALALAALLGIYLWDAAPGTLGELSRILHGQWEDSFGSHRVQIWRAVAETVPQRPFLGGGFGTLGQRIDILFTRYVPETGNTLRTAVNNAHNEYLGYAADMGVPGLALYLGAMASTLRASLHRRGGMTLPGWGVVSYWIQAFFALGLCLSAPLLWIFWGLWIGECEKTVGEDG